MHPSDITCVLGSSILVSYWQIAPLVCCWWTVVYSYRTGFCFTALCITSYRIRGWVRKQGFPPFCELQDSVRKTAQSKTIIFLFIFGTSFAMLMEQYFKAATLVVVSNIASFLMHFYYIWAIIFFSRFI